MVPKRDPKALAESILKILSDKDLSLKFGKNRRNKNYKRLFMGKHC